MTATLSNAHKTAIARKTLSKPTRWLLNAGCLQGDVLDYGCGRGGDVKQLEIEGYDPHWQPECPEGPFDTIMCNFVLNVIEYDDVRRDVLRAIDGLLRADGCAYITVRNDRKALKGETSIGTWQGLITLDLPVAHKCAGYVTYRFCKGDSDCAMTEKTFAG